MKMENQWLQLKLKESEGKTTCTNSQVASLKSKCEDLEFRAMKTNIVIYNVPEKQNEDIYNVIEDLLANKLRIPDDLIHSCRHPAALVQIDVAHRIGKPGAKPRPIVVKLVTQRGKDIIFAHVRNLKGSKISISNQLPSEMRERRDVQIQSFRELRNQHRGDTSVKVRLRKDKILLNDSLVPQPFESRPLDTCYYDATPLDHNKLLHTDVTQVSGSHFQGHLMEIHSVTEARSAYCSLFQNPDIARAQHIIYAYTTPEGSIHITGHSDDGEYSASKILGDITKEKGLENIFLAVTRIHNGPNLGMKRFELISSAARKVIAVYTNVY